LFSAGPEIGAPRAELHGWSAVESPRIFSLEVLRVIDPKQLLEQVLGGNMPTDVRSAGRQMKDRLDRTSGTSAFAGGAVAGGLLGLLLGGKKMRRMAGGALGYGGAAAIGALALRAYQTYQQQQDGAGAMHPPEPSQRGTPALPHLQPAADGGSFELVLVRAMVGAAKADGHIDAKEQKRLFAEVERLGLDAEAKAYVFDLLTKDVDLESLTNAVSSPEQGAELYLSARLAIDTDEPVERAYLDALATRLRLPAALRAQLDGASSEGAPST
jgi:uncharacterized membrane protein YebE (DUF533 family)